MHTWEQEAQDSLHSDHLLTAPKKAHCPCSYPLTQRTHKLLGKTEEKKKKKKESYLYYQINY